MRPLAKLSGLFAIFVILTASSAPVQSTNSQKQVCEDAKTQAEMNQCTAAAYAAADKDLNTAYQSVRGKLDEASITKLQAAQRAWISYRDANCEAEASLYQGGSMQPAVRSECMERVSRARIAELHTIYDTGSR